MSIIIEDEGIPQSRILSCGGFRDLGCLQAFVVSFRSSGRFTKKQSKLSAISPSGAKHHW
jgi:hypothetical protein